jgi:hypothetical protein
LFWIIWWIFFWLTYWFPAHWFPGWHPQGKVLALAQTDAWQFCIFVFTKSNAGLISNMFFTYIFIYLLSPFFLLKGKYVSFIIATAVLLLAIVFYTYNNLLIGYQKNLQAFDPHVVKTLPDKGYLFRCAWENILFNCPATAGIALGIKLLKRWYLKQTEIQQITIAKASVELQLLKAQVHPHFLFNTLNNIYSFTLKASPKAPEMVKKLKELLHYIIYECNDEKVRLDKELKMLKDYMSLERIRYGDELDMTIDIRGNAEDKMIAPLLLLPFVENSFKHGTSKMLSRPWLSLNIIIEEDRFYFMLNNSKPEEYSGSNCQGGIGLNNVEKRLRLLYPNKHKLNLTIEPTHFTVLLEIDLQSTNKKASVKDSYKKTEDYEMV